MFGGEQLEDLTGEIFGRLTVLDYAGNYKWNCKCSCGVQKAVRGGDLRSGRTKSCGCLRKELTSARWRADLAGQKFGRLTVKEYVGSKKYCSLWRCVCDCGNEAIVKGKYLLNGDTKSCGCLITDVLKERNTTHGLSYKSRLYTVWKGMRDRCNNPHSDEYKNYGGRGISVCQEWNDFVAFYQWAVNNGYDESLPSTECSIDRIDNNGNYCPDNCRWTSMTQQARNTRRNRFLSHNGEKKTVVEWGEIYKICPQYIIQRIDRYGWSVEDAITTPVLHKGAKYGHRKSFGQC